jgi:hypothetical protein
MDCPDDDTYAGFLQGLLTAERAAAIESHLDVCPRCIELAVAFGRLYARPGEPPAAAPAPASASLPMSPSRSAPAGDRGRWLAVTLAVIAGVHVAWTIAALPLALRIWSAPGGAFRGPWAGPLALAAAAYSIGWAPPGGALALVAAWGLWRRRAWARGAARWHALLSLPSLILTPLAAYVLFELGPHRRRGGG